MSYYLRVRGKPFGPFDENQLLDMKAKGKVFKNTELSSDRVNWFLAETLEFLFKPEPVSHQPEQSNRQATSHTSYTAPAAPESAVWFYSADGSVGYGPVVRSAVVQMVQNGTLTQNSYVWKEGGTAEFIKKVPEFAECFGGRSSKTNSKQEDYTDIAALSGDFSELIKPLPDSFGWLMFLKIFFLICWATAAIAIIGSLIWSLSSAVGSDSVKLFLFIVLYFAVVIGNNFLYFKSFLHFWKYHSLLQRSVFSNDIVSFKRANKNLVECWKWWSIAIITSLAIALVSIIVMLVLGGFTAGAFSRPLL